MGGEFHVIINPLSFLRQQALILLHVIVLVFTFKSESCKGYNPLSEHHHSEEQLTQQIQKANIKFHLPQIKITQYKLPKIVIVLENSVRMNGEDQWKFIRTACKKLILHDLPENAEVGLVTFNEDANISHAIGNSNYLIVEKF